ALHTLNGSAAMAGAHAIAELVDPFEQYCKLTTEAGGKLSQDDVQLLSDVIAMVPQQLEMLRTAGPAPDGLDALTTRLRRRLIDAINKDTDATPPSAPAPAAPRAVAKPAPVQSTVRISELPDF